MSYAARCPKCGATIRLPESDAGTRVLCLSCGTTFTARQLTAADAEPAPDDPLAGLLDDSYQREPARIEPPVIHPPPPRSSPWIYIAVTAAILLAAGLLGAGFYWAMRTPPLPTGNVAASRSTAGTRQADTDDQLLETPASQPSATDAGQARTTTSAPTTAKARRPAPVALPDDPSVITDDRIGQSIARGVNHLLLQFDPKTAQLRESMSGGDEGYICGLNALCIYALLQCGQAMPADKRLDVHGPPMRLLLATMKRLPANSGKVIYARGIRATALALYNRPEDRSALTLDVMYLVAAHRDGAYDYAPPPVSAVGPFPWDNSNSQYGLLGVWSGAEAGLSVRPDYWTAVQKHWARHQTPQGMWAYRPEQNGTVSMTAAGTASLFVAEDYLYADRFTQRIGREPFTEPLQRALNWWESAGDLAIPEPYVGFWGYALYGIERVGLASGFKYFGKRDWYRELAAQAVARQKEDGSWDNLIDTAYALLFLSRGRHPVLMNKLRFDKHGPDGQSPGFWANRPRDAANLTRYAGKQLERPLNWQVVSLEREWHDWLDAPILSIASHEPPYLTDADRDKLRQYALAGGLLFLHADNGSPAFDAFAKDLAKSLFPEHPLEDAPRAHPLYNVLYKIPPPHPPLKVVSNGVRVLLLYSPTDITRHWQLRAEEAAAGAFRLGTNLFVYAAGKRELRNRLSSPYVPPPTVWPPPLGTVDVARVRYGPGPTWDPEPAAWPRFANLFARQTGTGLALRTVDLKHLKSDKAPVAALTGTAPYTPTPDELESLRAYVEQGGVLVADAAGASSQFAESVKAALAKAFPAAKLQPLPAAHPLMNAGPPGMTDLRKPRVRRFVIEQPNDVLTPSPQFLKSGKGAVVVSNIDLTSGLLGTETWGIYGYEPSYAQSLIKNMVFWTVDGKPE